MLVLHPHKLFGDREEHVKQVTYHIIIDLGSFLPY